MKTVTFENGRRIAIGGVPGPEPKRHVAARDLWRAFELAERDALEASALPRVKSWLRQITLEGGIPVGELLPALNALAQRGILAAGRAQEIADALR